MGEVIDLSNWERFRKYLKDNVANNISKIAANFGSMITTLLGILLYAVKADLDPVTTLIVIMFAIQPFFNIWINIIFKGKAELDSHQIDLLKQNLEFQRNLEEYKLRVIALKANLKWEETNELLKEVNELDGANSA